jgi:hypothetical protein
MNGRSHDPGFEKHPASLKDMRMGRKKPLVIVTRKLQRR